MVRRQTLRWTEMDLSENYPIPSGTLVTTRITTLESAYKALHFMDLESAVIDKQE